MSILGSWSRRLVAVTAAALLAGCAATGDPRAAAVVNGETVSLDRVRAAFEVRSANPQVQEQLGADPAAEEQLTAQIAGELVFIEIVEQGAADLGVEVDDADVDARLDEVVAQQFGDRENFEEQLAAQGLSEDDVRTNVRATLLQEGVVAALSGDATELDQAALEAAYAQQFPASVRHILVASEEEAVVALERIQGGEDFAAVAAEVSTDTGTAPAGGDLGPLQPGQFVEAFQQAAEAAAFGEVVGPVETEFGFHLIELLPPPPLDEVEEQIRATAAEEGSGAAVQQWVRDRLAEAVVEVNPRVGVWDPENGQIVAADPLGELIEATPATDPQQQALDGLLEGQPAPGAPAPTAPQG